MTNKYKKNKPSELRINESENIFIESIKKIQESKLTALKEKRKGVSYPKGGLALYTIRSKLGLLQKEFAEIWGVTAPTLGRWEAGKSRPPLHTLMVMQSKLPEDVARLVNVQDFGYELKKFEYN